MSLAELDDMRSHQAKLEETVKLLEENERSVTIKVVDQSTYIGTERSRYGMQAVQKIKEVVSYKNIDDIMIELTNKAEERFRDSISNLNSKLYGLDKDIADRDHEIRDLKDMMTRLNRDVLEKMKEIEELNKKLQSPDDNPRIKELEEELKQTENELSHFITDHNGMVAEFHNWKKRGFWRRLFNLPPKTQV